MITILRCQTPKQLKLFEQTPEKILKNDPHFVPPFPGSVAKLFNPRKSPFLKRGELHPFVAMRDGKVVGRIAAIVNKAHNAHYKDKLGFFGFFDFIDDKEVSKALLTKAQQVLQERGCEGLRGPFNPTYEECGVLTHGFERPAFIMMPYNPEYYIAHYEALGLKHVRNLFAYYFPRALGISEGINKIAQRVQKRNGLTLRSINMKRIHDELKVVHKLYNSTLNETWGFVPVELEDLEAIAGDLKAMADPKLVLIIEKDGVPVGFSMTFPNINEFLGRTKGLPSLLRILKVAAKLKMGRPKEARLAVLGVVPEYRNKGLGAMFYTETFRQRQKYIGAEISYIDEKNTEMLKIIETVGVKHYRTYGVYENQ